MIRLTSALPTRESDHHPTLTRILLSGVNPTAQKLSSAVLAQMFDPIREDLERVEREFVRHLESQVALIPTIGHYIQQGGGKRIRPAVLLMAARMNGYTGEHAPLFASVIEFIHTATLVHDDIIDESEVRRGRQAVHSRWGNDVTVLLGDFLYIKSMSLALSRDNLDFIRLLCETTLPMIHLLASGDAHAEVLIRKIVKDRDATIDEWRELRNLLAQHRSIDYARRTATDFVERAKAALDIFPATAERDALTYLPDY